MVKIATPRLRRRRAPAALALGLLAAWVAASVLALLLSATVASAALARRER
jgi:hypothetical protein